MRFEDLLEEYGIAFAAEGHRHGRRGWINVKCPRCEGDPYLGYNINGAYFSCWRCGYIPIIEGLVELTGENWQKCKDLTAQLNRVARDPFMVGERPVNKYRKLVMPDGVGFLLLPHIRYIRDRKLDPKVLQAIWGIRGIGIADRLQWSLFIPIHYQGEIVSWTTRSISENSGRRYISAGRKEEKVNAKFLLFGEDHCRNSIVVTEGPLDAMRIGPGAVSTLGVDVTPPQIRRISSYPIRTIIFDNESGAQERARDLCDALGVLPGRTHNVVIDAKDPASAKPKEIDLIRRRFL